MQEGLHGEILAEDVKIDPEAVSHLVSPVFNQTCRAND